MKKISIFGFTGNLGTQALDILKSYKNQFEFDIFVCDKNLNLAESIVRELNPKSKVSVIRVESIQKKQINYKNKQKRTEESQKKDEQVYKNNYPVQQRLVQKQKEVQGKFKKK